MAAPTAAAVVAAAPTKEWRSEWSECFVDMPTCLLGTFCTPCLFGRNVNRLDNDINDESWVNGPCCIWGTLYAVGLYFFVPCCCHAPKRTNFRLKFGNLKEDPCTDWLAAWCLTPCAVCQEARELDAMIGKGKIIENEKAAADGAAPGASATMK
eukprot:TRINITY_DN4425_c0_g1_i1.p2 TRINITY_DN4425_c0_g1~~TRINITY_DN4425_c0_g1_i1.p2  ORF type:complete len:154 (+),score=40.83 TRINITY_DN4425_c0_g1_i1:45-506(+)